jgi:hypothetical protein
MKKGIYFFSLGFFLISLIGVASAGGLDDTYFMICEDSGCENPLALFEKQESPIYIQAFNYPEGTEFSGVLTTPDGEEKELDFSHLFFSDDYVKIGFSGLGLYTGRVSAETEDDYFEADFSFKVVEKRAEIVEFGYKGECEEVNPIIVSQEKREQIKRDLEFEEQKKLAFETISVAREESGFDNFSSGEYDKDWNCPDEAGGFECKVEKEIMRLHSLTPAGAKQECGESVKGKIELRGERWFVGSRQGTMQDALEEAKDELKTRFEDVQCTGGCEKEMSFGVVKAKDTLFNLLGASYEFGYEIKCVRKIGVLEDWEFEVSVLGEQRCVKK